MCNVVDKSVVLGTYSVSVVSLEASHPRRCTGIWLPASTHRKERINAHNAQHAMHKYVVSHNTKALLLLDVAAQAHIRRVSNYNTGGRTAGTGHRCLFALPRKEDRSEEERCLASSMIQAGSCLHTC